VRFAAGLAAQRAFALHHGQPARREVWEDEAINQRFGGCFRATIATMDAAWIRPRHRGYLTFQAKGGELIEQHLRGNITPAALLAELQAQYAASWG
jgi:multiple sugar transport system substrate-binding protein